MILYQYKNNIHDNSKQDKKYFIDLLTKGSIKFTNPVDFNDPFDCYPNLWDSELPVGSMPNAVVDKSNYMLQKELSRVVGVTCFTPYNDKMESLFNPT